MTGSGAIPVPKSLSFSGLTRESMQHFMVGIDPRVKREDDKPNPQSTPATHPRKAS